MNPRAGFVRGLPRGLSPERVWQRTGLAGCLGIALLLLAFAALWPEVRGLTRKQEALRNDLARSGTRASAAGGTAIHGTGTRARIDALYGHLGNPVGTEHDLARLFAIAAKVDVPLRSAEYRIERLTGSTVVGYRIRMPVEGSYAQVRAFVENALQEVPYLALERIDLRRKDSTGRAEAMLELVLYQTGTGAR